MKKEFSIGNVIKLSGSIVIIYKIDDKLTHWISFNHENSSGSYPNLTYKETSTCYDCSSNDGISDIECENCHGLGVYVETIDGMDKAEFLANNVKEYIVKALTKNFNF